jgi:hypothetical protein
MGPETNTIERTMPTAADKYMSVEMQTRESALDFFNHNLESGFMRLAPTGPSNQFIIKEIGAVTGANHWDKISIYEIWQEGMVLGWTNDRGLAIAELTGDVGIDLSIRYIDKAA